MTVEAGQQVSWIPIDRITVPNPRVRDRRIFQEIVENIATIGLKRPITVTHSKADEQLYELVCGQGRLEAFQALKQDKVPALIVAADEESCLIASLVENCARRQHTALDLLRDVGGMRERGHSTSEIARQTGLSEDYVQDVSRLLARGEERLLRAVETRQIPITVAVRISEADDPDIQRALQDAYDAGTLRGRKLLAAKRLIEHRRRFGKGAIKSGVRRSEQVSSTDLVKALEEESERKGALIRRSNAARERLLTVVEALRRLREDERFLALVEDEGLATMPEVLSRRLDAEDLRT
jgi:ParB family chromosome partitioning protein